MTKSEVYSWRLTPELKQELEAAARREKTSVGAVIERAAREWLQCRKPAFDEAEQKRLREAMLALAGTVEGDGIPATNQRVREVITARLTAKYDKSRPR